MRRLTSLFLGIVLLLSLGFSYAQGNVQVKKWAVITSAASNIRSMPSKSGEIIHVAKRGDRLEVLEDLGIWLRVKLPDGRVGFVRSGEVRVEVEKVVKSAPPAQAKPSRPTYTPPSSGAKPTVSKRRSLLPLYIAGGAALAGGAAYLLFRKGGLLNRGTATLKVNSTPSPADFYLDDEKKCETPCTVENVPPGKHKLRVVRELYGEWSKEMELKGHQEYEIQANLSPYGYDFDFCFGVSGSASGEIAPVLSTFWDLTVDKNGNIYVANTDYFNLLKFNSQGNFLLKMDTVTPGGIRLAPSGIVYSPYNERLYVVFFDDPAGALNWYNLNFGWLGNNFLGLFHPRFLGIDSSGNVYIADAGNDRIVKTDPDGNKIGEWGTGRGSWPEEAAPGPNGDIYVSLGGADKIVIYSSSGAKKGEFSRSIDDPRGVAVDRMGHVYVSAGNEHKIYKFTEDGEMILSFGEKGSGDAQFKYPLGIAVYENGDLAIADSGNIRICIWRLSSETISSASARITARRKRSGYINMPIRKTNRHWTNPINLRLNHRKLRK